MSKKIYVVTEKRIEGGEAAYLVRANNSAQAIRAIVEPQFTAKLASQDELVALAGAGIKVREAGE